MNAVEIYNIKTFGTLNFMKIIKPNCKRQQIDSENEVNDC